MSTTAPGDSAAGPSRGITIATGAPAASAASSATRASPSPASTESTIVRWTERRRSTRGADPAGSGRVGRAPSTGSWAAPTTSYACAAKSGWACNVSSPDSPVRIL